jgi:hypothetical protein
MSDWPDFPWTLERSFEGGQEINLAIQVRHFQAPNKHGAISERDPAADPGEVDFGDAVNVATGNTIELTPAEWQACEEAFWNQ